MNTPTRMTQTDAAVIARHLLELKTVPDSTEAQIGVLDRVSTHLMQHIKFMDAGAPDLSNNKPLSDASIVDYFAVNADLSIHHNEKGTVSLASAQAVMGTHFPPKGSEPIEIVIWWARALARLRYVHAAAMLEVRTDKQA